MKRKKKWEKGRRILEEREGRGKRDRVLVWSREIRERVWRRAQGQCGFFLLPISSTKYQTCHSECQALESTRCGFIFWFHHLVTMCL